MATFKQKSNGMWQAQVAIKGHRVAKSFKLKSQAKDWAAMKEAEIIASHSSKKVVSGTFGDLLDKYKTQVSSKKRSARWEQIRIEKIKRDPIALVPLDELSPSDFADWRDRQLDLISGASGLREMQILSHALKVARLEWGWIQTNPLEGVRRPKEGKPRDRLISQDEIDRLIYAAGYNGTVQTAQHKVMHAFLFAIETAMRSGEIIGLKWPDIDIEKRVAKLHDEMTKNTYGRGVSLSSKAIELLQSLDRSTVFVFDLKPGQIDGTFRKLKQNALIEDLHFHDTRHEAITRLSKKLDILPLARMVGHRNLKTLQVYYNETPEEIAKKLD